VVSQINAGQVEDICLPESRETANEILELVRYANVESHKPLVKDELKFIIQHPQIARKLLTMTPLE
jgi:homocitrate synthase NifV